MALRLRGRALCLYGRRGFVTAAIYNTVHESTVRAPVQKKSSKSCTFIFQICHISQFSQDIARRILNGVTFVVLWFTSPVGSSSQIVVEIQPNSCSLP